MVTKIDSERNLGGVAFGTSAPRAGVRVKSVALPTEHRGRGRVASGARALGGARRAIRAGDTLRARAAGGAARAGGRALALAAGARGGAHGRGGARGRACLALARSVDDGRAARARGLRVRAAV